MMWSYDHVAAACAAVPLFCHRHRHRTTIVSKTTVHGDLTLVFYNTFFVTSAYCNIISIELYFG